MVLKTNAQATYQESPKLYTRVYIGVANPVFYVKDAIYEIISLTFLLVQRQNYT